MSTLSKLFAAAAASACIAGCANSAAAQPLWTIIPRAHAEPAPPVPEQPNDTKPDAHAQTPSVNKSTHQGLAERHFSGKASFYSYRRAKTATGAWFDRDQLTAAHRSLPFGTKVRVTDVATNKTVVVRITDRGPFVRNRVLDLSLAAARSLGITDSGVAQVRADVI
jgi:peptidoglycan lytic transglycosylase